jgi:hypothetical protein
MEKMNEIKINKSYIKNADEFYKHLEEHKIEIKDIHIFKLVKNYLNQIEFDKIITNNFDNFKNLNYINL